MSVCSAQGADMKTSRISLEEVVVQQVQASFYFVILCRTEIPGSVRNPEAASAEAAIIRIQCQADSMKAGRKKYPG